MTSIRIRVRRKGGPGSGNWGHVGRPGQVGGSSPGGTSVSTSSSIKDFQDRGLGVATTITATAMHGFEEVDYMLSALRNGEFGRDDFTSIGAAGSKIAKSYQNHLWFDTPKNAIPVFYMNDSARGSHPEMEAKLGRVGKEIQYQAHHKEQEMYVKGKVTISNLRAIVYSEYATTEEISALNAEADRLGVPAYSYTKFRNAGYKL